MTVLISIIEVMRLLYMRSMRFSKKQSLATAKLCFLSQNDYIIPATTIWWLGELKPLNNNGFADSVLVAQCSPRSIFRRIDPGFGLFYRWEFQHYNTGRLPVTFQV